MFSRPCVREALRLLTVVTSDRFGAKSVLSEAATFFAYRKKAERAMAKGEPKPEIISSRDSLTVRIPIEPIPYARTGGHGLIRYTTTKTRHYMQEVRFFAGKAMDGRPLFSGALMLAATFVFQPPASWSAKKKQAAFWKTSAPDLSNLIKSVEDAIKGCVYGDDAKIVIYDRPRKIYGDKPLVEFTITALSDDDRP
jgi:Holliday junction resolvase RusA-like endonuclease